MCAQNKNKHSLDEDKILNVLLIFLATSYRIFLSVFLFFLLEKLKYILYNYEIIF